MSHLQIKRSPDGRIMARRKDGRSLTLADREQARRMIEPKTISPTVTVDDVSNIFFTEKERHGWRYLVVKRTENYPQGPLTVGPGLRIEDVAKFAERTIGDLLSYISAQNRGAAHHWVERILNEKLEYLKICGIKAEIRKLQ